MAKFRVYYNTHKYTDCSDTPKASSRIVEADSPDDARQKVRDMGKVGVRHIGMVHQAEEIAEVK